MFIPFTKCFTGAERKYMKRIIYRVCRSDITDFKTIFVKTSLI